MASGDSDMVEDFKAMKEHRREQRADRRESGTEDILALTAAGYRVKAVTEYQFRVDDRLDLFPTCRRFHNLQTRKRGHYASAAAIVQKTLGKK